jgi:hypothetical protein
MGISQAATLVGVLRTAIGPTSLAGQQAVRSTRQDIVCKSSAIHK